MFELAIVAGAVAYIVLRVAWERRVTTSTRVRREAATHAARRTRDDPR